MSINTNLTGLLTLAYFDNQQTIMPTLAAPLTTASRTLGANEHLPMTTVTTWAEATQANAAVFNMPGFGTTSRLLTIGSASSDLLAAASILLVGGAALALVARRVLFARIAAPAAHRNPV